MAASRRVKVTLWSLVLATFIFSLSLLSQMPIARISKHNANKLVVVMLDGLGQAEVRALMRATDDSAFAAIAARGPHVEFMRPIFPTLTQPNHYALLTGQYAEDHGVVHNVIYNETTKNEDPFVRCPRMWLRGVEPVWLAAQRKNYRVSLSTSECHAVPVLNITATCNETKMPGEEVKMFEHNLRTAYDRLVNGDTVFAIVHTPVVHEVIHVHGPASTEVQETVDQLDTVLRGFLKDVGSLKDQLNVMIVSDVGLASTLDKKPIFIDAVLNETDVEKMVVSGAHLSLWPRKGKLESVMEVLRHLEGIRAETKDGYMLEKFHYKNNGLIAPIQVVADSGYYMLCNQTSVVHGGHVSTPKGLHGYDPFHVDAMKAVFFAQGPQFAMATRIPYIHATEVYHIIRRVLLLDQHTAHVRDGVMRKFNAHH